MSNLILDSLEIRNFRGLSDLRIERLGRVNLIVGKNNVGKTSLLEALRLLAQPGSPSVLIDILQTRNEIDRESDPSLGIRHRPVPVETLFSERRVIPGKSQPITIGPIDSEARTLKIRVGWLRTSGDKRDPEDSFVEGLLEKPIAGSILVMAYEYGSKLIYRPIGAPFALSDPNDHYIESAEHIGSPEKRQGVRSIFVNPDGLSPLRVGTLWDLITLTPLENDVLKALQIISPLIEGLNLKQISEPSRTRAPFAKVKSFAMPVPLRSLGDGVNRVFGIALAAVNAKDGFLLIDEIENGVHYSVQADVWRLLFLLAGRLNVQVFATTHSYDCIKAFEIAARGSEEDGVLIRLAQKAGRTLVGEFDEQDLGIAVEGQIEVR